ncbi:peptidoglycan -binding protein [Defluviimonas sp. WL0075]|uniref:Peptidoglycan -binding protein n=1 Tax=Albidovulum sediminicola TaxID=2984331 RepID=A0ABT2Z5M4_9RHOB|nr:peptidoglycan -binding protein [Defluviimonas sp. WL0075]MCV2866457.1 peptidoglycan -binding protein [Defluviimonas sp. WL0075]
MAQSNGRGGQRFSTNIWPGFVDAMTALLMVLMFVLTIFMIVQFTLRETIDNQDDELAALADQVAGLADALGLERDRSAAFEVEVQGLNADLSAARSEADRQSVLIATLTRQVEGQAAELAQASARITTFEAQVASLLSERDSARAEVQDLTETRDRLLSDQEALNLALAKARDEVDAQAEAARLAAARRDAMNALIADLRARAEARDAALAEAQEQLSEAEKDRLAEAAAAALLRERLKSSEGELTAMTLALEEKRKEAEETLTLLAAAQGRDAEGRTEAERKAALLAFAEEELAKQKEVSLAAQRNVALLNQQLAALRTQLGSLQSLLDASAARDAEAKVQIESLGSQLNSALAQVASEQRLRAELEEAERKRLEEEAKSLRDETKQLARYRSEFFGKLSEVLAGREGVRVVGDRFVFSSEVLFETGSAQLSGEGQSQIAGVVSILRDISDQIPPAIDWIIRVDGHTDNVPISSGQFRDNWELSQARALSVVRFMQDDLGFPPQRMAATGFGEYRPVAEGDTAEARAQNRRIELKLTER